MLILTWIALAALVATLGNKRNIGFGWALVLSLALSPVVGLIITLISEKKKAYVPPPPTQAQLDFAEADKYAYKGRYAEARDK